MLDLTSLSRPYDFKMIDSLIHACSFIFHRRLKAVISVYLVKNTVQGYIIEAITTAYAGEKYFRGPVFHKIIDFSDPESTKAPIDLLTKREKEVLELIADEKSSGEIAEALFISINTVNSHRKNMIKKLRVKNTAGLLRFAFTHKWEMGSRRKR